MNYNQQICVLGHELSHVSDYSNTGFLKMCSFLGIQIFSKLQVDKFEARTDKICIDHGLGFQLLDWSRAVRLKLYIKNWRGANNFERVSVKERYLNPETIQELINQNKLYFELK